MHRKTISFIATTWLITLLDLMVRLLELWVAVEFVERFDSEVGITEPKLVVEDLVPLLEADTLFNDWAGE